MHILVQKVGTGQGNLFQFYNCICLCVVWLMLMHLYCLWLLSFVNLHRQCTVNSGVKVKWVCFTVGCCINLLPHLSGPRGAESLVDSYAGLSSPQPSLELLTGLSGKQRPQETSSLPTRFTAPWRHCGNLVQTDQDLPPGSSKVTGHKQCETLLLWKWVI